MEEIRAIIVEDEELAIRNLEKKLERNCPQAKIIDTCQNAEDAIASISKHKPHLVFLDVELGTLNGFDVLQRLKFMKFAVIFITNTRDYAIQAIRLDAIDFLEKPIDEFELVEAVNKVWKILKEKNNPTEVKESIPKVAVPILHGQRYLNVEEIIYCEAANTQTIFYMFNREEILVSRVLKAVEKLLSPFNFLRIHRKYLINRDFLNEFNKSDGGYVLMEKEIRLPVAKSNFDLFK